MRRFGTVHPANPVLGPCPCNGCGTLLWWARGQTRFGWNGPVIPGPLSWREVGGKRHRCAVKAKAA